MEHIMSRVGSSEGGSYSDFSDPITPEFSPCLTSSPFKDDVVIHDSLPLLADLDLTIRPSLEFEQKTNSLTTSIPRRICFIGAGYVGGPTAAVMALHNPHIHVDVVDRDHNRIEEWKSGHLPIHEPGLEKVVRVARDGAERWLSPPMDSDQRETPQTPVLRKPNLFFSTDVAVSISQADIVFIAVSTPTKAFGMGAGRAADMSAFDSCTDQVVLHAKPGVIVVEKSTVPCGTAKRIAKKFHTRRPCVRFEVLSNPEFLAESTAMNDLLNPDRIVIGCSSTTPGRAAAAMLARIYQAWVPSSKILTSNAFSSELSKLIANAMLAQRISSINSVSAICEATGADINEISQVVGHDTRIGSKFLKSGLGFGGSCFHKDVASLVYLSQCLGLDEVAEYWNQVIVMNHFQRRRFVQRVIKRLDENLTEKKLTVLGFAFKKGTGDCRNSLAADVVKMLMDERPKEIAIFDPLCRPENIIRELEHVIIGGEDQNNDTGCRRAALKAMVKIYQDPYLACATANAVLIVTDCDEFKPGLASQSSAPLPQQDRNHRPAWHSQNTASDRVAAANGTDVSYLTVNFMNLETGCNQDSNNSDSDSTTHQYRLFPSSSPTKSSESDAHATARVSSFSWAHLIRGLHWPGKIFDGRHVLGQRDVDQIQQDIDKLRQSQQDDDDAEAIATVDVEWIGLQS